MATFLKTMKDKFGNIIAPRTRSEAVYHGGNNVPVNDILGDLTYTEQNIVTNGESITDSIDKLDVDLASHKAESASDDVHGLAYKGAILYLSADQSIPHNTATFLSFDGVIYDTSNFYNPSYPGRLTVPGGVSKVRLTALITFSLNSTGRRFIVFRKNGTSFSGSGASNYQPSSDFVTIGNITSAIIDVIPGDYFQIEVIQTSGGSLSVASGTTGPHFSIEVIE